ncbi:hypothetical protein EGQ24_07005 [bacterium]|nr:hypothetical protein [bacterium]
MGLACSNIRLLTLTARKADCEYGISIDSMQKMALSREQTQLSQEYNSKLKAKQISYYANGKYNKINYSYLMGYGNNYSAVTGRTQPLKSQNSMILTDFKGQVVMSKAYANAITSVLGSSAMNTQGRGGTFSTDQIPAILAKLLPGFTEAQFKNAIDGKTQDSTSYDANGKQTITGEDTGNKVTVDNTKTTTSKIQSIVDFYYPIFQAAAANGWTTEYNNDMGTNDDYVSDALSSGTFQLATVNDEGNYEPDTSLTYYVTSGLVAQNNNSEVREEVTAWYEAEKARISEKEDYLDIDMDNLSTELESINTEIQSIQSLIDDAISSVFDWGSK